MFRTRDCILVCWQNVQYDYWVIEPIYLRSLYRIYFSAPHSHHCCGNSTVVVVVDCNSLLSVIHGSPVRPRVSTAFCVAINRFALLNCQPHSWTAAIFAMFADSWSYLVPSHPRAWTGLHAYNHSTHYSLSTYISQGTTPMLLFLTKAYLQISNPP